MTPTRLRFLSLSLIFTLMLVDSRGTGLSLGPLNTSISRGRKSRRFDSIAAAASHRTFPWRQITRGYEMVPGAATALSTTARGGGGDEVDPTSNKLRGRLTLLAVAFLYGTLNVGLRALYASPGPPVASALSATRGWLAAACFLPLLPQIRQEATVSDFAAKENEGKHVPLYIAALELAFWNFGAQGLLNVGLLFTESARASFLTQTSVVITPLISLLAGQSVSRNVWVGCAVALSGLALLSGGDAGAEAATSGAASALSLLSFSTGDLLVLGGALCWSIYIFRTSSISDRYPEVSLQAVKTTLLAVLYTSWLASAAWSCYNAGGWDEVAKLWLGWKNLQSWAILAFSAIGPGALADVLQQRGQKELSASEANVILCGEPVFTAILAYVLSGEVTSPKENAGGGLIVLAAVLASTSGLA